MHLRSKNLKFVLFTLFSVFPFFANAQITIRGNVRDEVTGAPIPDASVYYNFTKIGTKTNEAGNFMLYADGEYKDLVISCVGYEKVSVASVVKNAQLKITLKPINQSLKEVIIGNQTKENPDEWKKWEKLFFTLLMGDNSHAYYPAKIINPEVIKFHYNKKMNTLTATNYEPIYIDHVMLGYKIKLDLEEFSYNFLTEELVYRSSVFFEEQLNYAKRDNIQYQTNLAYFGSKAHFFKALVDNKLAEEGFKLFRYQSVKNKERDRVVNVINKLKLERISSDQIKSTFAWNDLVKNKDSLKYYQEFLAQPAVLAKTITEISKDSISSFDPVSKLTLINFKDSILVEYTPLKERYAMHLSSSYIIPEHGKKEEPKQETVVFLINTEPFYLTEQGYALTNTLKTTGIMGSIRLAQRLPYDFDPSVPRFKAKRDEPKTH